MINRYRQVAVLVLGLALYGCDSGGSHYSKNKDADTTTDNSFTGFVKTLVDDDSIFSDPVDINNRQFDVSDNDPTAFNDVL